MSEWLENLKHYCLSDDMDYRLTYDDAGAALDEIERLRDGLAQKDVLSQNAKMRDEIERLQKELDEAEEVVLEECRLRAALERIANEIGHDDHDFEWAEKIAREALQEGTD